jgi:hypothetical protein
MARHEENVSLERCPQSFGYQAAEAHQRGARLKNRQLSP